jgi:hypothetical protein
VRRAGTVSFDLGPVIWAVWAAFAAIALTATRADPDLWGHVRFGLDWLRTHSLPAVDPYSFTQDRPWINHEWLSEALMAAAYTSAGHSGLIALKVVIVSVALFFVARRLRGCTPAVITTVLAVVLVCMLPTTLTVRPHLWTLLGLVLLLTLIDRRGRPTWSSMFAGALLFAFWANLHGGWITGASVLAIYTGVRIVTERRDVARWLTLAFVSIAGTLANPYGAGLWRFLAATVRSSRPDITEWAPLGLSSPLILWTPLAATALVSLALSWRNTTRPRPEVLAALALLIFGAIRVERVSGLVAPAAFTLLAPYIRRAWGHHGRVTVAGLAPAALFGIPAIVALAAAAPSVVKPFSCLTFTGDWSPDRAGGAYLIGASGRLVTTFDWGEYAIWHFGPHLKVSIDGRRETVYSNAVIDWHRAFERGEAHGTAIVSELAPEYVWMRSSRSAAKRWLVENGYRIDADTGVSFVASRRDLPPPMAPAQTLGACFP